MGFSATVNPKGAQRIKKGHPWIFRSDVLGSQAEPGQIVEVLDTKKRFLGQAFFSPKSQITLRMLSFTRSPIGRDFWKKRIEASIARRPLAKDFQKNPEKTSKQACRLVFGESDLLPSLIVDKYANVIVFQTLSAGMDAVRDDILSILQELLNPSAIVERNDPPVRDLEGLVRQKGIVAGSLPASLEILEGNCLFSVDPLEGQKTGLFLDQAENHVTAKSYAHGRVLDAFSYQGGFALPVASVADEVTAVDSSAPALRILHENCERNAIRNVQTVEDNGFDFLRGCQETRETFDTVILDPPPFIRDRKNFSGGLRGYKDVNLRAMKILREGGILITCSCSQNFTASHFEEMLIEAANDAHCSVQILERRGAAADHPVLLTFPESSYLQCWILRIL